ncbi:MAG: phenylalanine--tRNA ligase subunit beta [Janthinobacterium lividum]
MDILTQWLRSFLPELPVDDAQLAEDLTLRGIAVEGVFPAGLNGDKPGGSRFEMDITTNRVDAMNHYGVAREAATIYDLPLTRLEDGIAAPIETAGGGNGFPVRIEAADLCGRFTARVIRGVTVKPATGMVAEYFKALGQKAISGPVDATNFGWLAMGQPTHVFDLDTLEGGLVVRRARAGERLRLLDGTDRTLTAEDLVVADERKALGLAGVMGGWDSRVTEATKNILVEAAWFDPAAIRASSRRHGLHTDASHRFERGADFNAAPVANDLVTRLVREQAGGVVDGPMVDVVVPEIAAKTANRERITLRVSEVRRMLGTTLEDAVTAAGERTSGLTDEVVSQYLTSLGCALQATGEAAGEYAVTLPSWRLDLEREIDLIEEIARVYGYNRFANTLPGWSGAVVEQPGRRGEAAIRSTLRALGYSEAISSTFVSVAEAMSFGDGKAGTVAIGNPLNEEAGMLRPSLLPGMASMLARNLARDVTSVRLFEMGTVFTGSTAEVQEEPGLVLGATGEAVAGALHRAADAGLFAIKGTVEALLAKFAGEIRFEAGSEGKPLPAWVEVGRGARVLFDGAAVGVFGELSGAEMGVRKLRQTCALAEIDAAALLKRSLRQPALRELSRFQAVVRDLSFIFPDAIRWSEIESTVRGLQLAELRRVEPLEIFRDPKGKAIAADKYSLLTHFVFQSAERTLTEEELTAWCERITTALTALGGVQRAPE